MRRLQRYCVIAALLTWSAATVAALPTAFNNGWHTWQLQNRSDYVIYVRFDSGRPTDIHISNGDCCHEPRGKVSDHGVVSPIDNYRWFREILEQRDLDDTVRSGALVGIAQSDTDEAYAYLDELILGPD